MSDSVTEGGYECKSSDSVRQEAIHPLTARKRKSILSLPLAEAIAQLQRLQRRRVAYIKVQGSCDRQTEVVIAAYLVGSYETLKKKDGGKAAWNEAKRQRKLVEKGEGCREEIEEIRQQILLSAEQRRKWDELRKNTEKPMEEIAKTLPVWPWVESVLGFGAKGLGMIIAETGNLSSYQRKEQVWKRLGVAVIDGERQRRKKNKEAALRHSYKPVRRAQLYVVADSLFRAQWNSPKAEIMKAVLENPEALEAIGGEARLKKLSKDQLMEVASEFGIPIEGKPNGPYGEVYLREKLKAQDKIAKTDNLPWDDPDKWTNRRVHSHAKRLMSKKLVADLLKEWWRMEGKAPA